MKSYNMKGIWKWIRKNIRNVIHRDAEAKHSVIVFFSRIVRNDHAVGNNKSWVFWSARKQTHWMSGIHDERLLVRHCHQVMKREPKLEIRYRPLCFHDFFFLTFLVRKIFWRAKFFGAWKSKKLMRFDEFAFLARKCFSRMKTENSCVFTIFVIKIFLGAKTFLVRKPKIVLRMARKTWRGSAPPSLS